MRDFADAAMKAWPRLIVALLVFPASITAEVKVVGRQILVNGKALHLKGVCWNPVPKGGVHPVNLDFKGFVESDSILMAHAGINAVRTYDAITDPEVLDVLWSKGIYVLNTVYIWGKAPLHTIVKNVNAVKNHPAILMWVVGNEWNYNGLYVGLPFPDALKRVQQAVDLIKQTDGSHPVATVHGEVPSADTLNALSNVDIWGINKYSGLSFGNLFQQWETISDKPIFLGEYGADAYNTKISQIDEHSQAKATKVLTQEIVAASSVNGGVCIGGIIFEFADEWWKDGSGNPNRHDVGGVSPGGGPYPDMTFNEEWWGLVTLEGTPREAYSAYAAIAVPGSGEVAHPVELSSLMTSTPLRTKACGAHPTCVGQLGNCCPAASGDYNSCCNSAATTTTKAPSESSAPSTTWLPPQISGQVSGGSQQQSHTGGGFAFQECSKFANGHFKLGTDGCTGVGECQFKTRTGAQNFCSNQPRCTAVLLHPFEDGCAGGYGCYTPRFGPISTNSLWDRSGGKAWVKGAQQSTPQVVPERPTGPTGPRYAFAGFANGNEAAGVCKQHGGQLAMPKTAVQQHSLLFAIDAAQAAGKMSKKWPNNTIWLGGYWNGEKNAPQGTWEWNDGQAITEFNWAAGQPSAVKHQSTEPWLCMILTGEMHDSDPPYPFGIMCEIDDGTPTPPATPAPPTPPPYVAPPPVVTPVTPPPTRPPPTIPVAISPKRHGDYEFVGFTRPGEARQACGVHKRLAMPKTKSKQQALKFAIDAALADGEMSSTWPENTIWIGGQWNAADVEWQWDDGSPITEVNWAAGQPSSSHNQTREPWLCMVQDGHVHDSDPPYSFGVMCEDAVDFASSSPVIFHAAAAALAPATPAPTSPPQRVTPPVGGNANGHFSYNFVGYATPDKARTACNGRGMLAMPKTSNEQQALQAAVNSALNSGQMSNEWPKNTIWLGGQWSVEHKRWEWDDGDAITRVNWAAGQPSAAQDDQTREPWLCMVSDGHVHDSDPPYSFGVMCQEEKDGMVVRSMLEISPPESSQVTWIIGRETESCDDVCSGHGGCNEEAWPRSAGEFEDIVLRDTFHECKVEGGGNNYDPSSAGSACGWQGPEHDSRSYKKRCHRPAPYGARRFCPCGGELEKKSYVTQPIFS